jgi:hypothetical protein
MIVLRAARRGNLDYQKNRLSFGWLTSNIVAQIGVTCAEGDARPKIPPFELKSRISS